MPENVKPEHENEEAEYEAHQDAIHDKAEDLSYNFIGSVVDTTIPQKQYDIIWALVMMADGDDLTNFIELEMKNGGNLEDKTEVSVTEFNKYFMRNYGFISHSLTNKQVEKFLNQDVIKRVSISKKADYFQDYLLSNGLADDVQMMAGGNIQSIEKKVAEVNELIEMGNKNNVSVTDTSSTWQSPMKYKPFVYKNGILYENYDELDLYLYSKTGDRKWRIVKHKYTKSGDGVDTQKEVLNNVAKMYRKELKYYADYDNYMLRPKAKNGTYIEPVKIKVGDRVVHNADHSTGTVQFIDEDGHIIWRKDEDGFDEKSMPKFLTKMHKAQNGMNIKGANTYQNRGEWKMALQTSDALMVSTKATQYGEDYDFLKGKIEYKKQGEHLVAYLGKIKMGYWDYSLNEGYIYYDKFKNGTTIKKIYPKNENALMVINNNKQIKHHTEELNNVVNSDTEVPAWVVAKVNRSASDLSDATHYLEGVNSKYANGGTTTGFNYEIGGL